MIKDTELPDMIEPDLDDPRIQSALDELRGMILKRFPETTFEVGPHPDMVGIWLVAIADVDNLDDVTDVVVSRMVDMQVDEGLPIYVVGNWPPARLRAYLQQQKAFSPPLDPTQHAPILTA